MVDKSNVTAIIQARTGSKRLPNKVFADLAGKPIIWHIINRIRACQKVEKLVLATTRNISDDKLELWGIENNIMVYRGSEEDVLERFYNAAIASNAKLILRITADDPFRDPVIINNVIELLLNNKLDFAYNNFPPTFPEGLDVELFTFNALETAQKESRESFEREHVTQYFFKHPEKFKQENYSNIEDLSRLRLTIDTEEDLEMARIIYDEIYHEEKIFLLTDILGLLKDKPWIFEINSTVKRSAMYEGITLRRK